MAQILQKELKEGREILNHTLVVESPTPRSPPSSVTSRHKIVRSCLLCHQRKIRCDKRSPCSNCVRADVVCCYPTSEPPGRRPPKSTIAEVAARVARLERTIAALSNNAFNVDFNNSSTTSSKSPSSEMDTGKAQTVGDSPDELLVQDGYSTRYINDVLLSRVLDEERELQQVMGSSDPAGNPGRESSSFNIGGLFSGFNQSKTDTQIYHPPRWHAVQLWQVFINNVDPIAKVLHIPTTQTTVFAAINNPNNFEHDLNALLFSIYFAATTSLTSAAAANLLGQDKVVSLNHYKQGLEQSLAGAEILDKPTMKSLQALTIYLICLRAYNGGRSIWTLHGLAIRSAQSIGLHRDGKNFSLAPFESEMRRRLWWYMCAIDSRAAEDHGIVLGDPRESSDTCFPLNVNDSELTPAMPGLPVEQARWTEMTFPIAMLEAGRVLQRINRTPDASLATATSDPSGDQVVQDLMTHLEEIYLKFCDANIPIQNATRLFSCMIVAKLKFLGSQPWLKRWDVEKQASYANEDALLSACRILEMSIELATEDLLTGFRWCFETYTQYHLLTYLLWHLCVKPAGPNIERAWKAINDSFEAAKHQEFTSDPGSKWTVLQRLKEKALRIRQSYDNAENSAAKSSTTLGGSAEMGTVVDGFGDGPDLVLDDNDDWDFNAADLDMHNFEGIDFSMSFP